MLLALEFLAVRLNIGTMCSNSEKLVEKYQNFSPIDYYQLFYSDVDAEVQFFLEELHNLFTKDEECILYGVPDRTLLEIGSGPTISSVLSASAWTDSIVLSDLLSANRDLICAWLESGEVPDTLDWWPVLHAVEQLESDYGKNKIKYNKIIKHYHSKIDNSDIVSCNIEDTDSGNAGKVDYFHTGEKHLLNRLRSCVKTVIPCNVHCKSPLSDDNARFDVVLTSLCLEFASDNMTDYVQSVINVATLLVEDGCLVMQGALGNTYYYIGTTRFPSVSLSRQLIADTLNAAKLHLIYWREIPRMCSQNKMADHTGCFFLVARKLATPK